MLDARKLIAGGCALLLFMFTGIASLKLVTDGDLEGSDSEQTKSAKASSRSVDMPETAMNFIKKLKRRLRLPRKVDRITKLVDIRPAGAKALQYVYEVDIDDKMMKKFSRHQLEVVTVKRNCSNKVARDIFDQGYSLMHYYRRTNGQFLAHFSVTNSHCGGVKAKKQGWFNMPVVVNNYKPPKSDSYNPERSKKKYQPLKSDSYNPSKYKSSSRRSSYRKKIATKRAVERAWGKQD